MKPCSLAEIAKKLDKLNKSQSRNNAYYSAKTDLYVKGFIAREELVEEYLASDDAMRMREIRDHLGKWIASLGFGSETRRYFDNLDLDRNREGRLSFKDLILEYSGYK